MGDCRQGHNRERYGKQGKGKDTMRVIGKDEVRGKDKKDYRGRERHRRLGRLKLQGAPRKARASIGKDKEQEERQR